MKIFVHQTLAITILSILVETATGKDCSGQRICDINNKSYERFQFPTTYERAKSRCSQWGEQHGSTGRLATIMNSEEQKTINAMLTFSQPEISLQGSQLINRLLLLRGWGYFIGAQYSPVFQSWIWNNQTDVVYSYWQNDFVPSNQNENCAKVLTNIQSNPIELGRWMAISCNKNMFYICERDILTSSTPTCDADKLPSVDFRTIDKSISECGNDQTERFIRGWRTRHNSHWEIINTGKNIEIMPYPKNSNWMTFELSRTKYFIDHMTLKWGSSFNDGSEHSVNGVHEAGELQVFLKDNDGVFHHVLVFLLQERTFTDNRHWDELIRHIGQCQNVNQTSSCQTPRNGVRFLLRDTLPSRSSLNFPRFIESASFRYHRLLPHPFCTKKVTWTVFTRAINLSSSQFNQLRRVRTDQSSADDIQNSAKFPEPSLCTLIA